MSGPIPFNHATLVGRELEHVRTAFERGHIMGDGEFSRLCCEVLEQEVGVLRALLTPSCTHALEMAALLLDLQPGDEVIVPSFTFVSTANAFAIHGARIVFADVRDDTCNLDERLLAGLMTERTRAVVAVHYAGIACQMDAIAEVARPSGTVVVEDNAHGLFGSFRDQPLGSFGQLAAQSFHETKNFTCGEGGALLINDPALVDRAEVIREKGTDRSRFFRGLVDKYTWVDTGSSYLLSDVSAAVLYGQLEARAAIQRRRGEIWDRYRDRLAGWAEESGVRLPVVPPDRRHPAHLFHLLLPTETDRTRFIEWMAARGVSVVFHYLPLHLSPMGIRFGGREGLCPVSEEVSGRLVRLPFYVSLTDDEQDRVIDAVRSFRC